MWGGLGGAGCPLRWNWVSFRGPIDSLLVCVSQRQWTWIYPYREICLSGRVHGASEKQKNGAEKEEGGCC